MNNARSFVATLIVCGMFAAGCSSAAVKTKKPYIIPAALPGMSVTTAPELSVCISTGAASAQPGKIVLTESIKREIFKVAVSTIVNNETPVQKNTVFPTVKQNNAEPAIESTKALMAAPDEIMIQPARGMLDLTQPRPLKTARNLKPIVENIPAAPEATAIGSKINLETKTGNTILEPVIKFEAEQKSTPAQQQAAELPPAQIAVPENLPFPEKERPALPTVEPEVPVQEQERETGMKTETKSENIISEPAPAVSRENETIMRTENNESGKAIRAEAAPEAITARKASSVVHPAVTLRSAREEKPVTRKKPEQADTGKQRPARMHTVIMNDNLQSLAEKYYGDKSKWIVIYEANKDRIEKGMLEVGQTVLIP